MSANFFGRERNYRDFDGFNEGRTSIREFYAPTETYAERIDGLFSEIAAMGYRGVDLWTSHLHSDWATPRHVEGLLAASKNHHVEITSFAGSLKGTWADVETTIRLANEAGCPVLGMGCPFLPSEIERLSQLLEKHDVFLAFENHPKEPTPAVVLEKIGNGKYPRIGSCCDTGWWGTHGYSTVRAIDELRDHLMLVHLKNIVEPGKHDAARWDQGCLDLQPAVSRLKQIGYNGWISLEYEPLEGDPTEDCRKFRETVESWWHLAGSIPE